MPSANDVASVILARSGPWSDAMRLQKLLYYVQAWHLAVTDQPLFPEQIKAWKDGPVVPQVWHARKEPASRRAAEQTAESVELDGFTSDLVDLVIAEYGSMSGEELSALTHVEQPWIEARGGLADGEECRSPISVESMASYYRRARRLGGRTAVDLAAGGIHLPGQASEHPDVDAIIDGLGDEYDDPGDDPWGGANLHDTKQFESEKVGETPRRSYASR